VFRSSCPRSFPATNTLVHTGDVIFRIDGWRLQDRGRRWRANQDPQRRRRPIDRIGRQVTGADQRGSRQAQAKSRIRASPARRRADLDYDRQQTAEQQGFCLAPRPFEQSEAGRDQGPRRREGGAKQPLTRRRDNVESDKGRSRRESGKAQLAELKTLARQGRNANLDFTFSCGAPVDGTFSNRLVNTGDFITMGQRLGNVVPLDGRLHRRQLQGKTQLKRIRPGQPVTILRSTAYGHRKFAGFVDSIAPRGGIGVHLAAAGTTPTGNFTKIVAAAAGFAFRVPKEVCAGRTCCAPACSVYASVDHHQGCRGLPTSDTDLDSPTMTSSAIGHASFIDLGRFPRDASRGL